MPKTHMTYINVLVGMSKVIMGFQAHIHISRPNVQLKICRLHM